MNYITSRYITSLHPCMYSYYTQHTRTEQNRTEYTRILNIYIYMYAFKYIRTYVYIYIYIYIYICAHQNRCWFSLLPGWVPTRQGKRPPQAPEDVASSELTAGELQVSVLLVAAGLTDRSCWDGGLWVPRIDTVYTYIYIDLNWYILIFIFN